MLLLNVITMVLDIFSIGGISAVSGPAERHLSPMAYNLLGLSDWSDSLHLHPKCLRLVLLFNISPLRIQFSNTSIVSIVLSHFILDLRACYNSALDPSSSSYRVSTLHFAAAVEGNIGASLDDSWIRGRPEDEEDQTQFSAHPLSVGLIDKKSDESNR